MGTIRTDDEVVKLLKHPNNGVVKIKTLGSGNHGNQDHSDKRAGEQLRSAEEKADVGVLARIVGNKAAGEILGVGSTQVSQYTNGKNSNNESDPELRKKLESRLSFLEEKAVDKVDLFLSLILEPKVLELDADKMASSAEKMVNVLDKLRRRNEKNEDKVKLPNINIYGPSMIKSETYLVKEV